MQGSVQASHYFILFYLHANFISSMPPGFFFSHKYRDHHPLSLLSILSFLSSQVFRRIESEIFDNLRSRHSVFIPTNCMGTYDWPCIHWNYQTLLLIKEVILIGGGISCVTILPIFRCSFMIFLPTNIATNKILHRVFLFVTTMAKFFIFDFWRNWAFTFFSDITRVLSLILMKNTLKFNPKNQPWHLHGIEECVFW